MGSARASSGRRSEQDITLEEAYGESEVTPEDLNRMCELLAHWALRRGREMGILTDGNCRNRVTPDEIKGYGDNSESN